MKHASAATSLRAILFKKEMLLATVENPLIKTYPEPVRAYMIQSLSKDISDLTELLEELQSKE